MIEVKKWGPGFHLEIPKLAVHETRTQTGITLSKHETQELHQKLGVILSNELHYACVCCTTPIAATGMCMNCSRAYGIGKEEERTRIATNLRNKPWINTLPICDWIDRGAHYDDG